MRGSKETEWCRCLYSQETAQGREGKTLEGGKQVACQEGSASLKSTQTIILMRLAKCRLHHQLEEFASLRARADGFLGSGTHFSIIRGDWLGSLSRRH